MSDKDNHPQLAVLVKGMKQQDIDPYLCGRRGVRLPGYHGSDVNPNLLNLDPHTITSGTTREYRDYDDPGVTACFYNSAHQVGAAYGTIGQTLTNMILPSQAPPGTTDVMMTNITQWAVDDASKPLENTSTQLPPQDKMSRGTKILEPQFQSNSYVPLTEKTGHPTYGKPLSEKDPRWAQRNKITTSEQAFSGLGLGALGNLPGMIMSLAQTFAGLSKQQKQAIKANTSNNMWMSIQAVMSTTNDVGDYQQYSIVDRVHKETFANNMVSMLCNVSSYHELVQTVNELRSNTSLHGKEKLSTVEIPGSTAYGSIGIKIDGHGNITHNVSNSVAEAESAFDYLLTQDLNDYEIIAQFYGQINNTTLSVNSITYGKIEKGPDYDIEGQDVTANTYITNYLTGKGNTGTYVVNFSSNTAPNTVMTMYKVVNSTQKASNKGAGAPGNSLGGLIGMLPGINMFGEAAKLLSEQIKTLDPKSAARVQKIVQGAQQMQVRATGHILTGTQPIDNWNSAIGAVTKINY